MGSLTLQPEDTNSKSSNAEIALDKSRGSVKVRDTEMGGTDSASSLHFSPSSSQGSEYVDEYIDNELRKEPKEFQEETKEGRKKGREVQERSGQVKLSNSNLRDISPSCVS